ncbi:MAG: dipeptide/oligopeptide/nickel ABC transporter ATP-binding protein, partial [Jatrophihabitantaceae bacterium]
MTEPLLQVSDLTVRYRGADRAAVSGVSLDVLAGETVGLVGESGSGKSTIGRAILGLVRPSAGRISFAGKDIDAPTSWRGSASLRVARAGAVQAIFQDPYSSLNPTRTIGSSLAEPLLAHGFGRPASRTRVTAMLERVGLPVAAMQRYPAQFSGGQRQRIAIARAL